MKSSGLIRLLSGALLIAIIVCQAPEASSRQQTFPVKTFNKINTATHITTVSDNLTATVSYRINPGRSQFTANVGTGGLLWFMGHTHHFAVRDFTGEATLTDSSLAPASLQMTIKTASLEESGKDFTEQQKQIINKEAHNEVLEADKYPEITFKSTNVTGKMKSTGQYQVKIAGALTIHGVTRSIEIPAQVIVKDNTLQATGEFSVNRSDYKVKTKSIKGGTIRVRNKITFKFDIIADKV
jgi:polyisoprenoid-binding protein YceI